MAGLVKNWLQVVPWEAVISINAALCDARKALHKPTSDGYALAKELWEKNRLKKLSLPELLHLCFQCHRLAPFCNYNGNTFVTIVKTLLDAELNRMPPDQSYILRSIAGHRTEAVGFNISRAGKMSRLLMRRQWGMTMASSAGYLNSNLQKAGIFPIVRGSFIG